VFSCCLYSALHADDVHTHSIATSTGYEPKSLTTRIFFAGVSASQHAAAPSSRSSSPLSSAAPSSSSAVMRSLVVYRHAPRSCRRSFALRAQRRHCRSSAPRRSQPIVSLSLSRTRAARFGRSQCRSRPRCALEERMLNGTVVAGGEPNAASFNSSASLDTDDHPASAALHRATQTTVRLLCRHRTPIAAYTPSQNGVCKRALSHGSRGIIAASLVPPTARSRQSTALPSRTASRRLPPLISRTVPLSSVVRFSRASYRAPLHRWTSPHSPFALLLRL
jgi:hypothetical protein